MKGGEKKMGKRKWWWCLVAVIAVCFTFGSAHALPVQSIPDLVSITFWERSGGSSPTAYTFGIGSPQLTVRLTDPLSASNMDFGEGREPYDVFYSDAGGVFDINGEYVTIEALYNRVAPTGGGLNLAEVGLNFTSGPIEYANAVAGSLALGDNAVPSSVAFAVDGDLLTHTVMGNTVGQSDRLRVTVGFASTANTAPVPEPATMLLLGCGLAGIAACKRRFQKN
ncbi:MAG: PEP-CTERM sorting domain-containing protein [Desulfobacteraceae bacterium]|nr:MAG: PEP-CTERM sorting domain-containing protein [Desulfobacteraceae bacterium]